jgi:hypothetical protein
MTRTPSFGPRKAGLAAGAALLAALAAAPAAAVTMTATWTGIISNSINIGGGFGLADGVSLDGLAAVMVFVYDPSTPGASRSTGPFGDEVSGGSDVGFASPMSAASVTINGITQVLDTGRYARSDSFRHQAFDITGIENFSQFIEDVGALRTHDYSQASATTQDETPGFPIDLETPIPLTGLGIGGYSGTGIFQFGKCRFGGGQCPFEEQVLGIVTFDSVKIEAAAIPGTVPLPAALPLLAGALALLGGAARRHARAA